VTVGFPEIKRTGTPLLTLEATKGESPAPMEHSQRRCRILIAGLGNVLLMDDGVGVHAVRELLNDAPAGACVAEVGTAVLHALHLLETADRILAIDAVQAGGPPGTVYVFRAGDEKVQHRVSLHELSLMGALRFLGPAHPRPEIVILGVEPETIDYGLELTKEVAAALPQVLRVAKEIAEMWERNPDTWDLSALKGITVWR